MARVTVEDCLEKEENRFALVVLASHRSRQLLRGAPSLLKAKNKPCVMSLREIAVGRVHFHRDTHGVVAEFIEELKAAGGV